MRSLCTRAGRVKKVVLPGIGIQIAVGIFGACLSYLCLRFSPGFAVNKQP